MFQITDKILYQYFKRRQLKIFAVMDNPIDYQSRLLEKILSSNKQTEIGKAYGFKNIKDSETYSKSCPLHDYEAIYPYIEKMMDNATDILIRGKVDWYAKSSGTTNARSKYIPVTKEYLKHGHLKCAWDAASHIYHEDPNAKLFANKNLIMGGSLENLNHNKIAGDISAIILHHFPKIGRGFYTPTFETALLSDWDEKIKRTAQETIKEKVTLLAGIPTWTLVLLKEILKVTGAENISEVWPNLRSYLHGGVGFEPYRKEFRRLIPDAKVSFREVYNASEGYFALQNNRDTEGMLLLCDHGIYYEFIPKSEINKQEPTAVGLSDVILGDEYELVITTISGLYRYRMGDIIQFVSISPYKIKHTGRVQESINVYGEELYVGNTDQALSSLCNAYNLNVNNYTIAPAQVNSKGRHEWYIEFEETPNNIEQFQAELDTHLRRLNSDYDAKRSYD